MKIPYVGSIEVGNKLVNVRIRNRQLFHAREDSYTNKVSATNSFLARFPEGKNSYALRYQYAIPRSCSVQERRVRRAVKA
jgi:hypothetical protein